MLTRFMADNVALVLAVWAVIYASDYCLTIIGARFYLAMAREHTLVEGSYELTPIFQKDVNALRLFSPQFWIRWISSLLIILLAWLVFVLYAHLPEIFSILGGGLILREVVVHMRHGRNLFLFVSARNAQAWRSRIQYPRWLTLKMSAFEFFEFAILFTALALVVQEWFFVGGGLSCLLTGRQHWALGRAAQLASNHANPDDALSARK